MFKQLYPYKYIDSIFDLPLETLKKKGIRGLIFDIDNTLSPYDCPEPDEKTRQFFARAQRLGFSVCLLSNNSKERVFLYNRQIKVYTVARAAKPLRHGMKQALKKLRLSPAQVLFVGDQIFTDVWCGNRCGIRTVLVTPCSDKDEWITKIKRGLEGKVIAHHKKTTGKMN